MQKFVNFHPLIAGFLIVKFAKNTWIHLKKRVSERNPQTKIVQSEICQRIDYYSYMFQIYCISRLDCSSWHHWQSCIQAHRAVPKGVEDTRRLRKFSEINNFIRCGKQVSSLELRKKTEKKDTARRVTLFHIFLEPISSVNILTEN